MCFCSGEGCVCVCVGVDLLLLRSRSKAELADFSVDGYALDTISDTLLCLQTGA